MSTFRVSEGCLIYLSFCVRKFSILSACFHRRHHKNRNARIALPDLLPLKIGTIKESNVKLINSCLEVLRYVILYNCTDRERPKTHLRLFFQKHETQNQPLSLLPLSQAEISIDSSNHNNTAVPLYNINILYSLGYIL